MRSLNVDQATYAYKAKFALAVNQTCAPNKKAILLISVGQDYHENEKLVATIALVNQSRFQTCDIILADTLQHYNELHLLSKEEALLRSEAIGTDWLVRNDAILKKLLPASTVLRWSELLVHPDYEEYYQEIHSAYSSNASFRMAIDENITRYLSRREIISIAKRKELFKNSLAYLLEECPIIMPVAAKMGYDYIIYPQPITPAMHKTYELFVESMFKEKCRWLSLKFKKRKANENACLPKHSTRDNMLIAC